MGADDPSPWWMASPVAPTGGFVAGLAWSTANAVVELSVGDEAGEISASRSGPLILGWYCSACKRDRAAERRYTWENVPTDAPTFPSPNGPGRLLILRKLLYFSPVAQPAAWDAYKRL
jgi:hypothetical protein